jgi:sugar fermentation stimulation protein A
MQFQDLTRGYLVKRDNRFRVTVSLAGQEVAAHLPNSGRLVDLLTPQRPVWLAVAGDPLRKTSYDLKLVELDSGLVSVDARLPNPLFAEAIKVGQLPEFDYPLVEVEVTCGDSHLDFRLSGSKGVCWVETKSVTLVEDGVALFPDVPTRRGSKHLRTLLDLRRQGDRAVVVFIVQRADASSLVPHQTADPLFTATLREAVQAGVEARAYTCHVSLTRITLATAVPVAVPPP